MNPAHPAEPTIRRHGLRAWVLAAGLALAPWAVQADVWGYVDDKGVAHFASEKVDERYQLFYRQGQSFDTASGLPKDGSTPRPVQVPTAAPKLLAFFDVSPNYKQVKHHLKEASRIHGVDYDLLKALIATESGFSTTAVSPKGAVGLMQVMPTTAERWGVAGDRNAPVEKKLADPKINILTGTRYLRYLIDLFPGQLELALAAYNAGEGAVQRAGNRIPNYRETQNYVKTVMQLYAMLQPPSMARGNAPRRIRMELPGAAPVSAAAPAGGAIGRGNMPVTALPPQPVPAAPSRSNAAAEPAFF